jgi:hypothetical protein
MKQIERIVQITIALAAVAIVSVGQLPDRRIAITIDDLPVVSTRRDLENRRDITKKLLAHIKHAKVPAIGFVNENKLYSGDKRDETADRSASNVVGRRARTRQSHLLTSQFEYDPAQ